MIAFMMLGISCFVLGQLNGKWWWMLLAGAFTAAGPMFKPTATSAIGAIGLFVIMQPLMKNRTWKQTGRDILLLLAGAGLSLSPVYIWAATVNAPIRFWPYSFVWKVLIPQQDKITYVTKARELSSFSEQWQRVLRYYRLLILPIALAAGSIVARVILAWSGIIKNKKEIVYSRFVLLFAIWWLLDMAFVWISPRSYEQYYLPLNASAAMLGGYIVALYSDKLFETDNKPKWLSVGFIGLLCMIIMSWHIFFGIQTSPHTGRRYNNPGVRRGYVQRFNDIARRKRQGKIGAWEAVGDYIRTHSQQSDKIYVWGWYPGIYVRAQRFSPTPNAFTSEMHVISPQALSEMIAELLADFEKEKPKFVVDTHKRHFPWNRPPLELWPRTREGFLPPDKKSISKYDAMYKKMLQERINPDEALRYEAMKPFREFIMKNYSIVYTFGQHVLFKLKE